MFQFENLTRIRATLDRAAPYVLADLMGVVSLVVILLVSLHLPMPA